MELTLWTYEGPPHVGAMRIASSMRDIHYAKILPKISPVAIQEEEIIFSP